MNYKPFSGPRWRPRVLCHSASGLFRILILSILIFAGYDCHGASCSSSPDKAVNLSQFVAGIVTRSADLTYITEQDSEVFAFYRNTPVEEMTKGVFLATLKRPSDTPVIQQSWPVFFQGRTQNDSTGRWRDLQVYLEANLTNLAVFRVPRDPPYDAQYDLYAVGIFSGRIVVGVQMFGVAT